MFLSGGANTSLAGDFLQEVPNQSLDKLPTRLALLRAIDRELSSRSSYRPLPSGIVPQEMGPKLN